MVALLGLSERAGHRLPSMNLDEQRGVLHILQVKVNALDSLEAPQFQIEGVILTASSHMFDDVFILGPCGELFAFRDVCVRRCDRSRSRLQPPVHRAGLRRSSEPRGLRLCHRGLLVARARSSSAALRCRDSVLAHPRATNDARLPSKRQQEDAPGLRVRNGTAMATRPMREAVP